MAINAQTCPCGLNSQGSGIHSANPMRYRIDVQKTALPIGRRSSQRAAGMAKIRFMTAETAASNPIWNTDAPSRAA
jgi:hypothetical protein